MVTGYDVIWGERLNMEERGLYAAAMLLPGVGGSMLTKADDVAQLGFGLGKSPAKGSLPRLLVGQYKV